MTICIVRDLQDMAPGPRGVTTVRRLWYYNEFVDQ
jgi:hypothetical protein